MILSVLVRLPKIGRPLSEHHEWLTATSILHIQIWYENGIGRYHFAPVLSFNNKADKYINNWASEGMVDKEGNYYYTSYPPFAFIFPYFIFKFLHIYPTHTGLQIFNMILQCLCSIFLFLLIKKNLKSYRQIQLADKRKKNTP